MAYSDFTLKLVAKAFGVTTREADILPSAKAAVAPAWLIEVLGRRTQLALNNEKSRSEFIVAPILMASRELSPFPLAIFSGERLNVDAARGLIGECDFILAATAPVLPLRAPLITIVEAKRNDIEEGLGQCVAQMIAARMFNQAEGLDDSPIYGCVTNGEGWQFLELVGDIAVIDRRRYYLVELEAILGVIQAILARHQPPAPSIP